MMSPIGIKYCGMIFFMGKFFRGIRAIVSLFNPAKWGPFLYAYEISRFDYAFSISWSQGAEDLAVLPLLEEIHQGRYLDIGAHHPSRFSVTRHLYQRGWTGVNVDANADLLQEFNRCRPRDVNLNFCVGEMESYEFFTFEEPAISTVSQSWRDSFINEQNAYSKTSIVSGISLRKILEEYFPNQGPDFLNVDIEGADFEALKSGSFETLPEKLKPGWILVETRPPLAKVVQADTVEFLTSSGYEIWLILPFATLLGLRKP